MMIADRIEFYTRQQAHATQSTAQHLAELANAMHSSANDITRYVERLSEGSLDTLGGATRTDVVGWALGLADTQYNAANNVRNALARLNQIQGSLGAAHDIENSND